MLNVEKVDISVVLPCYNEASLLYENCIKVIRELQRTNCSFEIILVDDSSNDDTVKIIHRLCEEFTFCRMLLHEKNIGRGGTFVDGAKIASGEYVGFLDIDLEVSEKYIPVLYELLAGGADVATVKRYYKMRGSAVYVLRAVLSKAYSSLVKRILHLPYKDTETGYKFFNRKSLLKIIDETANKGWFWDTEIMAVAHSHGLKVKEIPGEFVKNKNKKTTVRLIPDTFVYFRELMRFKKKSKCHGNNLS